MSSTFKVHVRVRPMIEREVQNADFNCISVQNNTVNLKEQTGNALFDEFATPYQFVFDKVFGEKSSHGDIFGDVMPLLDSFITGYNAALLCYGLTSSGKTYTLSGIMSACVQHILSSAPPESFLTLSYLQIYNEQLDDLLSDAGHLRIRDNGRELYVENLSCFNIIGEQDVLSLIEAGNAKRRTAATAFNELSSRSHTVLIFTLETKNAQGQILKSKLKLVDLAGSERLMTQEKTLMRETQNINKSLNALGNVIFALTDAKQSHIPYRDSQLTRLLQDSIGASCMAQLIVCLSPASSVFYETLNSLRFAERAKRIRQKAEICVVESSESVLAALQQQLNDLRQELADLRANELAGSRASGAEQDGTRSAEGALSALDAHPEVVDAYSSPVALSRQKLHKFSIQDQISQLEFKLQHGGNLSSASLLDEVQRRQGQILSLQSQVGCIGNFQQVLQRQTETLIHLAQRIADKEVQIYQLEQDKAALVRYEAMLERRDEIFALATQLLQKTSAAESTSQRIENEEILKNLTPQETEAGLHVKEREICVLEAQIEAENAFVKEAQFYIANQQALRGIVQEQLCEKKTSKAVLLKYFQEQKALVQLIKNKFAVLLNKAQTGDRQSLDALKILCKQTIQAMEISQGEYQE